MKSVMISIHPKWCKLIANGKKTVEVRKTKPKIKTPFKCYIYCTNAAPYLVEQLRVVREFPLQIYRPGVKSLYGDRFDGGSFVSQYETLHGYSREDAVKIWGKVLNGKVIGEFVCDEILSIWSGYAGTDGDDCLSFDEREVYLGAKMGYGWHISDLQIYDKPKELKDFCYMPESFCEKGLCRGCPFDEAPDVNGEYMHGCEWKRPLKRPPQSWYYVEEVER